VRNLSSGLIQVTVYDWGLNLVKSSISKRSADSRPLFLAGDLALDFLNTRMNVGGEIRDLLQTDEDVLAWLEKAGLAKSKIGPDTKPLSLLRAARVLRENLRSLVEKRKSGRRGDPSVLNNFLRHARSHPLLVWNRDRSLTIERIQQRDRPEAVLAPVAESAAVLLATADFNLVKRCEDETCVLWFSDQTKSHRRRWCSTKICGNRHKVAAYRERRRDQNR
jgi:predicted RNA-binding Zn ribbon-like protein